MNMKILSVILLMSSSLVTFAQPQNGAQNAPQFGQQNGQQNGQGNGPAAPLTADCLSRVEVQYKAAKQTSQTELSEAQKLEMKECNMYRAMASKNGFDFKPVKVDSPRSMDGQIQCNLHEPFTMDFEACKKAVTYYNAAVVAETAMNETQKIRTDLNNRKISDEANRQAALGDSQSAMFDSAEASSKFSKQMETEKMAAYGMAVGALIAAHKAFPDAKDLAKKYGNTTGNGDPAFTAQDMQKFIQEKNGNLLGNQSAKTGLNAAIANFTAKAIAAGIKMSMYGKTAKNIEEAKKQIAPEEGQDLMMDRCVFNPTDPACAKSTGQRVSGNSYTGSGNFGLGDGGNNSFDLTPGSETGIEEGAPTNIQDGDPIAGINSPFVDEAKEAKDIMNPAGAAQAQASGGAAGGGGGGAGGGMGGGGASLGSDLAGANKDGDKEAQIKTGKVSGAYAQGGGGGFKGVGKSKDDANPFASLFDAKSNGGIEEDRSIASGDIDGASSGLFQKISKRYSQIQADKRIEANNLE